jgi:hypothetical protein
VKAAIAELRRRHGAGGLKVLKAMLKICLALATSVRALTVALVEREGCDVLGIAVEVEKGSVDKLMLGLLKYRPHEVQLGERAVEDRGTRVPVPQRVRWVLSQEVKG